MTNGTQTRLQKSLAANVSNGRLAKCYLQRIKKTHMKRYLATAEHHTYVNAWKMRTLLAMYLEYKDKPRYHSALIVD